MKLPDDFDYQQLARLTPGYVGADLMALCREAAMSAVNRVLLELRGQPKSQSSVEGLLTSRVEPEPAVSDGGLAQPHASHSTPVSQKDSRQNSRHAWSIEVGLIFL